MAHVHGFQHLRMSGQSLAPTIAQPLGQQVRIAHRHEQLKVEGAKAKAQRALEVLQALYELAAKPIAATSDFTCLCS